MSWRLIIGFVGFLLCCNQVQAQTCSQKWGSVRLNFTGDILVHKALYEWAEVSPNRFKYLWQELIPTLRDSQLTVGNLEGPVAPNILGNGHEVPDIGFVYDNKVYSGTNFSFNYHPYLIDDLLSSGYGLVTTANNHALDRLAIGADKTIEQLQLKNLAFVGTRTSQSREDRYKIMDVHGYKIGFVACTQMTNSGSDPRKQVLLCDSAEVIRSIKFLQPQTDAVIVLPHWGDEYQTSPNEYQKIMAKKWADAGAKLIVGNHPHVVQTKEWITNKLGQKTLAVYSLGNFVASQATLPKRVSAVIHVDWIKSHAGLEISQFSYTPFMRPVGQVSLALLNAGSEEFTYMQQQLGLPECAGF